MIARSVMAYWSSGRNKGKFSFLVCMCGFYILSVKSEGKMIKFVMRVTQNLAFKTIHQHRD